jgi:adenylate cyclase class IV
MRNLLDCIKSREETVAKLTVMHRSMNTVHFANICMWLERDMHFDPLKEDFINDEEATRLRARAQREPWLV